MAQAMAKDQKIAGFASSYRDSGVIQNGCRQFSQACLNPIGPPHRLARDRDGCRLCTG
ncbi:hypothetical protein EMIT0P218_10280 [Pseudomonas sp. IT-P218]